MKKILTAINNPKLNEKLKKENIAEIIGKDIQYKEGIIEILEKNKNIDLIIISENLPGEISIEKLIEEINKINKKIKIIYILEKENIQLEKILNKNYIYNIYYNNKITLNELVKNIKEKELKNEKELQEEIDKLKKILIENNLIIKKENNKKNILKKENKEENKNKINKKEIKNYIEKIKKLKEKKYIKIPKIKIKKYKSKKSDKKYEEKKIRLLSKNSIHNDIIFAKILTFVGSKESGKTTLSLKISNLLEKKNNKILIVDLDYYSNDVSRLLKNYLEKNKIKNEKYKNKISNKKIIKIKNEIKNNKYLKKYKKEKKLKLNSKKYNNINIKNIIKNNFKRINKNIYLITIKLKEKKYIENKKSEFIEEIKKMNNYFDYIIVDTKNLKNNKIIYKILEISSKIYIIIEPKILRIKETTEILKNIERNTKIRENSLHILINKEKLESIHPKIIKNIFKNFLVFNSKNYIKKLNIIKNIK